MAPLTQAADGAFDGVVADAVEDHVDALAVGEFQYGVFKVGLLVEDGVIGAEFADVVGLFGRTDGGENGRAGRFG